MTPIFEKKKIIIIIKRRLTKLKREPTDSLSETCLKILKAVTDMKV